MLLRRRTRVVTTETRSIHHYLPSEQYYQNKSISRLHHKDILSWCSARKHPNRVDS